MVKVLLSVKHKEGWRDAVIDNVLAINCRGGDADIYPSETIHVCIFADKTKVKVKPFGSNPRKAVELEIVER